MLFLFEIVTLKIDIWCCNSLSTVKSLNDSSFAISEVIVNVDLYFFFFNKNFMLIFIQSSDSQDSSEF